MCIEIRNEILNLMDDQIMKPMVTIGLCVKNSEETVREAITCIVNQEFPDDNMEVIVVDGCSQDQTLSIIKEGLSKRAIKLRIFSESTGLGFARQVVVDNALGKYIVWVDGDILLSPQYIEEQVVFMEQNPRVAIAIGSYGLISNNNWIALLESIGYVIESLKHNGKETSNFLGTRGSIFRVSAIKSVGGFDLTIIGAQEDLDVSRKISSIGWKLFVTNSTFYEKQKTTWNAIWERHYWYGYGLHFIKHKHKERNLFIDKSNDRIIISSLAYKLTHRKVVFLLPLNFVLRKIALLFGFLKSHFDEYGHNC